MLNDERDAERRTDAGSPPDPGPERADEEEAAEEFETAPGRPPPSQIESFEADDARGGGGVADDRTQAHSVPATAIGESTRCPRCGTENRPGVGFCRHCGQRLVAPGAATVARPGAPEGSQACPRCGTHNRAGTAFCQNCGANLRGAEPGPAAAAGYVPPALAREPAEHVEPAARRGAVLGPIVLLIGAAGLLTGWLLPFPYGAGSLLDRSFGDPGGYGAAFWAGYPDVAGGLADQAYFGFAAPVPLLVALLLALVVAGFVRARPGPLQLVGLVVTLVWAIGIVVLFVLVELLAADPSDLTSALRSLTPGGIILMLASIITLIGVLTRFARS